MSAQTTTHQSTREDEILRSGALVVEWYRLDQNRRIVIVLLLGSVLLAPGSALVALSLAPFGLEEPLRSLCLIFGLLFTASGPGFAIRGLTKMMNHDSYVALRTDGLVWSSSDRSEFIAWERVDRVEFGAGETSVLRDDGPPFVICESFAGIEAEELAKRITHVRRKALMGLF